MKIRTSLCAAHLLFAVSVLCACTQHVCGVDINNNKNKDNYSEEIVHYINNTKIENKVEDQRWFSRSMEEKNQAQKNKRNVRSLSLMNIAKAQEPDCASKCNNRILPEEYYNKRSGMFIPSCIFPFNWNSSSHNNCIEARKTNRTWCATRISLHTGLPLSSMWCDGDVLYGPQTDKYDLPPLPNNVDRNEEAACIMPFVHKNQVYYNCTSADSTAWWCATMLSVSGEVLLSKYCDPNKAKTKSLPPPPKMRDGEKRYVMDCIFPFWYRGVQYNDCTTADNIIPWCPTRIYTTDIGVEIPVSTVYCSFHPEYDPYPVILTPSERTDITIKQEEDFKCVFPILYRGVFHSICPTEYGNMAGRKWCAFETKHFLPTRLKWCDHGEFNESRLPPVEKVFGCPDCTDLFSTGCKVPYTYENKTYKRCNYGVFEIPWCPMEKNGEDISRIMPCNPEFE